MFFREDGVLLTADVSHAWSLLLEIAAHERKGLKPRKCCKDKKPKYREHTNKVYFQLGATYSED